MSSNQQLVLVNLLNFSCTAYTEEQFHDKLLYEITRNTMLFPSDDTKTFFIKWYQKAYNQSRRKYIVYHDDYGHEYKETPYSFAYLDKKNYLTFISAEQAYHLFCHYKRDKDVYYPWCSLHRKQRFAYRNPPDKHTSEKYYAKLADTKFDKSLGQPIARGGHQKNLFKSYWADWELEGRSECGNWKSDTKLRHQYLVNLVKKNRQK